MKTSDGSNLAFYQILARHAFGRHRYAQFMKYLAQRYPDNAEQRLKEGERARVAAWDAIAEAKEAKVRHLERMAA